MAGEIPPEVAIEGADPGMGAVPRSDGAFVQRKGGIGDDLGWIRSEPDAEAGTLRAGAFGAIEGKVTRSEARGAIAGQWILGFGG